MSLTLIHTSVPPTHTPVPPTATALPSRTPVPATLAPTATQPTIKPTNTPSVDLLSVPYNNLTDPAVQARIKQIYAVSKTRGLRPGDFRIVGDTTLVGISGVDDRKANLAQFKAQMEPVIQFFSASIKDVNSPSVNPKFTSAESSARQEVVDLA